MRLMTTKEKVWDCFLTLVIWTIAFAVFSYFSYGHPFADGMYWFGSFTGYCIAIFTNQIVKKKPPKESNPDIIDDCY